jgi:hypothetical protein
MYSTGSRLSAATPNNKLTQTKKEKRDTRNKDASNAKEGEKDKLPRPGEARMWDNR